MADRETLSFPLIAAEQTHESEAFTSEQLAEFAEIYRSSYAKCVNIAKLYRVRDPESTAQTAFEKALRNWNIYKDIGKSRNSWIYKIVANTALDEMRRESKVKIELTSRNFSFDKQANTNTTDIADVLAMEEYMNYIAEVLNDNPKWQEMLELKILGYSHSEISQELGVPIGTVRSGLFRAYKRLQDDEHLSQQLNRA